MVMKSPDQSAIWQQHLDKFRASGLSRVAYCREKGLKVHQLAYQLDRSGKTKEPGKAAFARVVVPEPTLAAATRAPTARLCFGGGVALELDSGADPAWIAQLIVHVGGRP